MSDEIKLKSKQEIDEMLTKIRKKIVETREILENKEMRTDYTNEKRLSYLCGRLEGIMWVCGWWSDILNEIYL